jgi:hypothetical protein
MYDSITAADIPADAGMLAGYVDGAVSRWTDADWARFPNAIKVHIAVSALTDDGDGIDVETGAATPLGAAYWIPRRQAAGVQRPFVYCDRSSLGFVQVACAGLNYDLCLADWTGVPHLVPGTIATQYDHPPNSGGHYDLSLVSDSWVVGGNDMTPEEHAWLKLVRDVLGGDSNANFLGWSREVTAKLDVLQSSVAALRSGGTTDITPVLASIQDLKTTVKSIKVTVG